MTSMLGTSSGRSSLGAGPAGDAVRGLDIDRREAQLGSDAGCPSSGLEEVNSGLRGVCLAAALREIEQPPVPGPQGATATRHDPCAARSS
jgi:hypothetical protein